MMTSSPEPGHGRRRLPVAVWLIPALGIVLPLCGVFYQMLADQGTRVARRTAPAATEALRTTGAGASGTGGAGAVSESGGASAAAAGARTATDFVPRPPAWSALLATAAPDDPARGQRLARQGVGATTPACATCHAPGAPAPQPLPRLEGMPAEYAVKELLDFRSGTRPSPVMGAIAKGLTDGDIASIARYYASQPRAPLGPLPGAGPAATLHALGDNARALPACTNCHGAHGEGGGPVLPPLAGQPRGYIAAQLNAFRAGTRANDDGGVMRAFASRLTDAEIAALDAFYAAAAQPPRAASR